MASALITINGFSDRNPFGSQISNPTVCSHTHTITESQFWERSIVLGKVYFCTFFTTCTRAERDAWHTTNWIPLLLKPPCYIWKKFPQAYPLPDACFLKLLQHFRASCSGANTSDHILWFQVKPYITTMAFPQFPLLSCLGLLYHSFYISNPSYFSIS